MPGEERPVPRHPGPTAPDVLRVAPAAAPTAAPSRAPAGAALAGGIPDGQYLGLAAGERLELSEGLRLAEPTRQAVFAGCGELVVMDHVHGHGHRMRHYRLPGSAEEDGRPVVSGIVVAVIRQKPVGWKSLGSHFLVFLNAAGVRVGEIDNSMDYGSRGAGTWEFNSEELRAL
jgi:hypothetical protein